MSALGGRQPRAVQSALEILGEVARAGPGVTAKEIADALDLAPATAYRMLNLLVGEEYLVRLQDLSGFALGARMAGLVRAASPLVVPTAARELLAEVRSHIRFGIHLICYLGATMRLADVDPDHPTGDQHLMVRHLHASAPGKLLLSELPDWRLRTPPGRLQRCTPATLIGEHDLDAELALIRREGLARDRGELDPDLAGLAVPVRGPGGRLVGATLVTARLARAQALEEHLDRLRSCAYGLGPLLA